MKNIFLTTLLIGIFSSASAQNYFTIKSPFKKSTYGTEEMRTITFKKLKTILKEPNDDQINSDLKKLSTKAGVSSAFMITGLIGVGAGLFLNTTGSEAGLPVMVAGLGVELIGAIASSGSVGLQKKMMSRYNVVKGAPVGFTPMLFYEQNKTAVGFNLNLQF